MATLGLLLLWGGYTFGMFGFSKIKSAYGNSPTLSLSDLALPSHRSTYIAAASAWGGGTSSNAGTTSATTATTTGSGTAIPAGQFPVAQGPPYPGSTIPSPQQTTSGAYVP